MQAAVRFRKVRSLSGALGPFFWVTSGQCLGSSCTVLAWTYPNWVWTRQLLSVDPRNAHAGE
jgi:hypothetical protein